MKWFGNRRKYHHDSPECRYYLKQALLFWGMVLLAAVLLVIWVVIQNMGPGLLHGSGGSWDPTRDWHQQLD